MFAKKLQKAEPNDAYTKEPEAPINVKMSMNPIKAAHKILIFLFKVKNLHYISGICFKVFR